MLDDQAVAGSRGHLGREPAEPVTAGPLGLKHGGVGVLDERLRLATVGDLEIATRISAFELAYRMQSSAPELMDLAGESKETLEMYGAEPGKPSYANACLLARRLVERGVRFVQIFHEAWDHHGGLTQGLKDQCGKTDAASAALVKDLKRRGLLDETLVIWGGEFGRTPKIANQDPSGRPGRDHWPRAMSVLLSGGGLRMGQVIGATSRKAEEPIERRMDSNCLLATIYRRFGIDPNRTFPDLSSRPIAILPSGEPIAELL